MFKVRTGSILSDRSAAKVYTCTSALVQVSKGTALATNLGPFAGLNINRSYPIRKRAVKETFEAYQRPTG